MAFIPVTNVAELVAIYLLPNAVNAVNVYNFEFQVGTIALSDLEGLADDFQAWESATAKAQRASEVSLVELRVRDLTQQNSFVLERDVTPPIAGTQVTPAMPANVTLAISFRTGQAGRSYRGRTYWIGLAEAQVAGNFVGATSVAAMEAALVTLRTTAISPLIWRQVVVSRFANGAPRQFGLASPITTSFAIDSRVDTQRRRLPGVGT